MLDHMIAYLRATLNASRSSTHSLQAEFERLRDYLELMAIRMGPRLEDSLQFAARAGAAPGAGLAAAAPRGKQHPARAGTEGGGRPHHRERAQ
jgi:hypothetical protein